MDYQIEVVCGKLGGFVDHIASVEAGPEVLDSCYCLGDEIRSVDGAPLVNSTLDPIVEGRARATITTSTVNRIFRHYRLP